MSRTWGNSSLKNFKYNLRRGSHILDPGNGQARGFDKPVLPIDKIQRLRIRKGLFEAQPHTSWINGLTRGIAFMGVV